MTEIGVYNSDSRKMTEIEDESLHLVVTSPCYPMIKQWDDFFSRNGRHTYEDMHSMLNGTWKECYRVLVDGGIMCVNIGDATRSHDGKFQLFPNHVTVTEYCKKLGFTVLPYILWKKITTKPNKFMGSGMYPVNAYVTQDCEYILIFRKGELRKFDSDEKERRVRSKYTVEQRNKWFSQVWDDIRGARQENLELGRRVAAFPEEIPYRLIRMFSIEGDTVLDPYMGTGTTLVVAMKTGRNTKGYEIDAPVFGYAHNKMMTVQSETKEYKGE